MARTFRADTPSTIRLCVRLTSDERALASQAARVNRQNLSAFLRDALVGAANDCLEVQHETRARSGRRCLVVK